jgi:hypothetical protein
MQAWKLADPVGAVVADDGAAVVALGAGAVVEALLDVELLPQAVSMAAATTRAAPAPAKRWDVDISPPRVPPRGRAGLLGT